VVVFHYSGDDPFLCSLMVASVKRVYDAVTVIQCSDANSPAAEGVDLVFRSKGTSDLLFMRERVQLFSDLNLDVPAVYVDGDLLWLRSIGVPETLGEDLEAVFCRRSFKSEEPFNPRFTDKVFSQKSQSFVAKKFDFPEYAGQRLGEVFPYVACFTIARNGRVWQKILANLETLPERYLHWYGDQEAIKRTVAKGTLRFSTIDERLCACLPEYLKEMGSPPITVHFKGGVRKGSMLAAARHLNLV
jgi:hypothetical protein